MEKVQIAWESIVFKPLDKSITIINNEHVFLKFIENDAPFYSKLEFYHNDNLISDCSFKPQEQGQIKENMNNFDNLMKVLKKLNKQIESRHLGDFIKLVESYNVLNELAEYRPAL